MFSTEHGPTGFDGPEGWDEVNIVRRGGNYGWPTAFGPTQPPPFVAPVRLYPEPLAPSGATFVRRRGSAWTGDFIFACLRGRQLRRLVLDGAAIVARSLAAGLLRPSPDRRRRPRRRSVRAHEQPRRPRRSGARRRPHPARHPTAGLRPALRLIGRRSRPSGLRCCTALPSIDDLDSAHSSHPEVLRPCPIERSCSGARRCSPRPRSPGSGSPPRPPSPAATATSRRRSSSRPRRPRPRRCRCPRRRPRPGARPGPAVPGAPRASRPRTTRRRPRRRHRIRRLDVASGRHQDDHEADGRGHDDPNGLRPGRWRRDVARARDAGRRHRPRRRLARAAPHVGRRRRRAASRHVVHLTGAVAPSPARAPGGRATPPLSRPPGASRPR